MNRIKLYELAVNTGKNSLSESSPGVIEDIISKAIEDNEVDDADRAVFKLYFNAGRSVYSQLGKLLPSEIIAKQEADAAAAKAAAKAKPVPAAEVTDKKK